ncbi:hypothetical protein [Halohasta salina]|uniref:hypothetical protein n=1 Tax=Halohasta salina TaxID=2961621 RepID=UPI0020A4080D|nr:hypothetical protein [Halohasta salina]
MSTQQNRSSGRRAANQELQTSGTSARVTVPKWAIERDFGDVDLSELDEQRVDFSYLGPRCYVVRLPDETGELPTITEAAENSLAGDVLSSD